MTLPVSTARNDYVGNGSTATYSYTFQIFEAADLLVETVTISTGVEDPPLVLNTDFTVTGVGNPAGGTITLVAGNLANTKDLVIRRLVALNQETSIRNNGEYFPDVIESTFDYLTAIDQQQQEQLSRALSLPDSILPSVFSPILPAALPGASVAIGSNPSGNGLVWGPSFGAIASAAANAAAAAASAAAAAASSTASGVSAAAALASQVAAAASAAAAAASVVAATPTVSVFTGTSVVPDNTKTNQTFVYTGSSAQNFSTTGMGTVASMVDGAILTFIGTSDANILSIANSDIANGRLQPGTIHLTKGDTAVYMVSRQLSRLVLIGGSYS